MMIRAPCAKAQKKNWAGQGVDFKKCCLQSGRYDGANRGEYFQVAGNL